jgi:hypothetical protein
VNHKYNMELYNIDYLRKPHWTGRNKLIAEHFLEPDKSVLDIGCGGKDLLRYYKPVRYLGVDGIVEADLVVDLNLDFKIPGGWDYVVCSGIFEHVDRADFLLKKLLNLGNEYIFTWWSSPGYGRLTHNRMEDVIRENYSIILEKNWGPVQKVYKCVQH